MDFVRIQRPEVVDRITSGTVEWLSKFRTRELWAGSLALLSLQAGLAVAEAEHDSQLLAEAAAVCQEVVCEEYLSPTATLTIPRQLPQTEATDSVPAPTPSFETTTTATTITPSPAPTTTITTIPPSGIFEAASAVVELAPLYPPHWIDRVPWLDGLVAPGRLSQETVDAQKQHIEWLKQNTPPISPEKYALFENTVDNETYTRIFEGHPNYEDVISARCLMVHWSGRHYKDILEMRDKMMSRAIEDGGPDLRSTHHIIDSRILHRTTPPERDFKAAHAKGANNDCVSIEQNHITQVEDYDPEDIEDLAMSIVYITRLRSWPINQYTILTHYISDLLANNRKYNPETGVLGPGGYVRKGDIPQDLFLGLVIPLAVELDMALGPR